MFKVDNVFTGVFHVTCCEMKKHGEKAVNA